MQLKSDYINPEHKSILEELEEYLTEITKEKIEVEETDYIGLFTKDRKAVFLSSFDGNIYEKNVFKVLFNEEGDIEGIKIYGFSAKFTNVLESISDLKTLLYLDLANNAISNIRFLESLTNLRELNLDNNQIKDIEPIITLHNIESFSIENNEIDNIQPLNKLHNIKALNLAGNKITNIQPLSNLEKLEVLKLESNPIYDLIPISLLTDLQSLYLSNCQIDNIVALKKLTRLEKLDLSVNLINDITPLEKLSNLTEFNASWNKISDITPLEKLTSLVKLDIEHNLIRDISPLEKLTNLTNLSIGNNQISDIIPLDKLDNVELIDLNSNQIKWLPEWIVRKGWFNAEVLKGNPLTEPSWDIVEQGRDAIRRWFEELKKKKVKPRDIKVILLGNTTVGKTTLVNYLINPNENPDPKNSTHGILVKDWQPEELNGITVHFWDFGGQEYYHATHKYFLSNESIYLLLWDKELNKNNLTGKSEHITYDIHYWLQNIRFFAPNRVLAPIFLVQTKAFFNPETKHLDDREEIISDHNIVKEIKKSFAISVLETYNLQLKHERTNSENKIINNFERFKSELFSLIEEQLSYEVPGYWEELRKVIQSARENQKLWTFEYYEKVAKNLDPDIDIEMCTSYLINRGEILYYPDIESLKNTVFIDPLYITQKIYEILRRDIINPNPEFTIDEVKQVIPDEKEAQGFIDLMKAPQFELIFEKPRQKGVFVVPQYLSLENEEVERRLKTLHLAFELRFETYFSLIFINRFISNFGEKAIEHIYSKKGIVFDMEIEGGKEAKFLVYTRPEEKIISVYTTSDGLNSVFLSEIKNFFVSFAADTSQLAFRKADTGFENLSIIEKHKLSQYQLRQNPINKVEISVVQDFIGKVLTINRKETLSEDSLSEIQRFFNQLVQFNTKAILEKMEDIIENQEIIKQFLEKLFDIVDKFKNPIILKFEIYKVFYNYGIIATDNSTVIKPKVVNK